MVVYLKFHFDYDRFHSKLDRIYIFTTKLSTPNETATTSISSVTTAPLIKSGSKSVEQTARLAHSQLQLRGNSLLPADVLFADASIFEIFNVPLIRGNKTTALKTPLSIVLTQDAAVRLFRHSDPLGKLVFLEDFDCAATVTALAQNLPRNSQIRTDAFISMPTLLELNDLYLNKGLEPVSVITYVLLKPNISAKLAQEELSNAFTGNTKMKREVLLTRKNIFLKPLRGTLLNPALTRFQRVSIYASSLIFFLMLFASIKKLIKIFLLQISISDNYMTITPKERNRKLIRKVCSTVLVTYLVSSLTSVGLISGMKYIFDFTITENASDPLYIGAAMLIMLVAASVCLCLWIAFMVPAEPIKTYLMLKKKLNIV